MKEIKDDSEDIFIQNSTDKYINRPDELEDLSIIDFFKNFKSCDSSIKNSFIDKCGKYWVKRKKQCVVRIYPYYTEYFADLYYSQMILTLTSFRDPKLLLESISDVRQHFFKSFLGKSLLDHSFDENYQEELKLTDNFDESVFDKIANMYSLKKSSFKVSPSQLNEEQYQVYKDLIYSKDRFHIISGSPGTGKSYLLRSIIDGCISLNTQCTVTASTGCAAFLIGGTTINSKLQLRYYEHISEWQILLFNSKKWQELENTSVLILDEFSMIGNDLFNKNMNILSDSRLSHIKFIMFGDPFQLDPVGDIPFFQSPYFQHFQKHKLKFNQRTNDEILSNLISNFYNFDIDSEDRLLQILDLINSRLTDFNMYDDSAYVYAFNSECRNHNNAVMRSLN